MLVLGVLMLLLRDCNECFVGENLHRFATRSNSKHNVFLLVAMRGAPLLVCLLSFLVICYARPFLKRPLPSSVPDEAIVQTKYGPVMGNVYDNYRNWQGITPSSIMLPCMLIKRIRRSVCLSPFRLVEMDESCASWSGACIAPLHCFHSPHPLSVGGCARLHQLYHCLCSDGRLARCSLQQV